ncbi:MAG: Crp/Fnr family transcriptional regulator [Chitinophagales bacterium]|nr:Crp/Fnr family transcriptional regulator [Chitinophagales bacterium]
MNSEGFKHIECKHCSQRFSHVICNPENDYHHSIDTHKICATFKKGEMLFKEGAYATGIFCVNQGKIKLSKLGEEGKEQIVRLVKSGDILGYKALLTGNKYSGSAIALEDSNVCFIPKDIFTGILKKDANLSFEMMKILSNQLKSTEDALMHLAQKPVRERVAEVVLYLKETYGVDDENNINVTLSREDFANIVGTATETCIRFLSEMKKEDIIEMSGKRIKIVNQAKLVRTANIFD